MEKPIFKHMELKCKCGSTCIRTAKEILFQAQKNFIPCKICNPITLKKFTPLAQQINLKSINSDFGRCSCGKRHLDLVMAHILKVMIEEGLQKPESNLRKTCIPLIHPAFHLNAAPYLGEKSLIVLTPNMNKNCADKILDEVIEVKGVLKGEASQTVGIKDSSYSPYVYDLLAGCDMRCDIVNSPYGPICIHKDQGEIHIEFPRQNNPKITSLSMFIQKKIMNNGLDSLKTDFTVLDATCGPGTLGIFSLMAGASKVVFNDLWKPATNMTALNLESNGFKVEFFDEYLEKCMVASGERFEVYHLDIRELEPFMDEKFDLCIIDAFPDVETSDFIKTAEKLAKNVFVI